jgi:hypothetical protein
MVRARSAHRSGRRWMCPSVIESVQWLGFAGLVRAEASKAASAYQARFFVPHDQRRQSVLNGPDRTHNREVSKLDQSLSETGRINREPAQTLSQKSDPGSDSKRGKKEALLCLQERTTPDCQAQGATQRAPATMETAEAAGIPVEHVHPYEGQPVLYHVHYAIKGPEALNGELIETGGPGSRQPKER